MSDVVEKTITDYRSIAGSLPGHDLPWLMRLREDALERFAARGYPSQRDEAWKYTNVGPIVRKGYAPVVADESSASAADIAPWLLSGADTLRLVFVDGRLAGALSSLAALPAGAVIGSLRQQLQQAPAEVERWLAAGVAGAGNGFADLNLALMTDGAFIRLPDGMQLEQPVHLLYVSRNSGRPSAAHLHNLVICGKGSRVTFIEHYGSLDGAETLLNTVTRCVLDDGAMVEHYKLNEQGDGVNHFAGVRVHQGKDSRYVSHNLQAGARIARVELHAELAGQGSECTMNGFYIGNGRQHIDNYTLIDHQVPHCSSRELYKGVLDGRARGIFNGHVIVRQDAQQTDARQMNQNLLLSADAEVDTRPQLEIYADDVKCSHGATIGQLDMDALFYLRARGIDEALAYRLLINAFSAEVIDLMSIAAVKERFRRLVSARLAH